MTPQQRRAAIAALIRSLDVPKRYSINTEATKPADKTRIILKGNVR